VAEDAAESTKARTSGGPGLDCSAEAGYRGDPASGSGTRGAVHPAEGRRQGHAHAGRLIMWVR